MNVSLRRMLFDIQFEWNAECYSTFGSNGMQNGISHSIRMECGMLFDIQFEWNAECYSTFASNWPQNGPRLAPNWPQNGSMSIGIVWECNAECYSTFVSNGMRNDIRHCVPKWLQNGSRMAPEWPQNGPRMFQNGLMSFGNLCEWNAECYSTFLSNGIRNAIRHSVRMAKIDQNG